MLDLTLATEFVPGTNLKGSVAGANWSFMLPSLELERVVCFGLPSTAALTTLARIGREVVVVGSDVRQLRAADTQRRLGNLANVRTLVLEGGTVAALPNTSIDLAVIVGRNGVRQLTSDDELSMELRRLLKPEGLVYCEFHGPPDQALAGMQRRAGGEGFGSPSLFWLTPLQGEMHTAVPLRDRVTMNYFIRQSLYSPSVKLRMFRRAERFLMRHHFLSRYTRRYGALLGRARPDLDERPPRYLRALAQESGIDLANHRWGLSARGQFSSRKVLFLLFDRESATPEYIVKMTRDPAFNPRLENEYRALTALHERGIGDRETLPQVVFHGHHGGLAIVGETMIAGTPFRQRTTARPDCPYARAAIDWLIELGAATADHTAATPWQAAESLEVLFRRFMQIYRLSPVQRNFLADQLAALGRSRAAFPLVFQHGDPGTWNILVTPQGRPVFLDWEAAEAQGIPLWDLFYFVRAFGAWSARLAGAKDSLKSFAQQFLAESAFSPLLIDATARYCAQTGLSTTLVEPLFYTCWMHRALKEATRLSSGRLERGHYVRLLRLCIDQRDSPTLRRLFSLATAC